MPKKVFISYSHDSEHHTKRALALADQLCGDGYDCLFDQYVGDPAEGWTQWMTTCINSADFILIIYTQGYLAKFNNDINAIDLSQGKGCKWEGRQLRNLIYKNGSVIDNVLPVLFDPNDQAFIIDILQDATYYLVDTPNHYQQLLTRLANCHRVEKPAIGQVKPPAQPAVRTNLFETPTTQRH